MKRALLLLVACTHPNPTPAPAPAAPPLHGLVFASCGPVDQPATSIIVTPTELSCAQPGYRDFVRLEVWSGARSGTVNVISSGSAQRCRADGSCEGAVIAKLDWGDATHPAHVTLVFTDGAREDGPLLLTRCDVAPECG